MSVQIRPNSSHWGTFDAVVDGDRVVEIRPFAEDPNPSPLLGNIADGIRSRARVTQPMARAGWLENGPGPDARRGADEWVALEWDEAISLAAAEYGRVYRDHGPEAVYGGSYGWASAGRVHHAQSQVHRFLNLLGGYVRSVNTYSNAAGDVILGRVAGPMAEIVHRATDWRHIVANTDLVVAFGGMPAKNVSVAPGGVSVHTVEGHLNGAAERGARFVYVSPIRDDLPAIGGEWLPIVPGTDVAAMLALAHVLIDEDLIDRAFLDRCTVGFDRLEAYVRGRSDGQPKTPAWAEGICGIPADRLAALAREMAAGRTLVNTSWSLQRAEHGEQPVWMALALAAMLGQVGLPGGGFGFGYGSMAEVGEPPLSYVVPRFPQGRNPVSAFIPVARVADMLLHPGEPFDYDGQRLAYPDIRLLVWAGGNPFHHHQDLGRLRRAFAAPETVIVHDPFWTATARHADLVFPSTVTLERDDIGAAPNDGWLIAMHRAVAPPGQARDDFAVLSDLAHALGVGQQFTEGRDAAGWLRHLYDGWRGGVAEVGIEVPAFDAFWEAGRIRLPNLEDGLVLFDAFRADPEAHPLPTPSGRIELYSETIAGFGYDDCPGHPAWLEPVEWAGAAVAERWPLTLVANNPKSRLHSQLDDGAFSRSTKVQGREPVRIHPDDAAARGIGDGEVVRLFNDRGSCLAGAVLSREVKRGVVQLSTGAWYDPLDPAEAGSPCVHGNPNALTFDRGTSRLAQGCAGQHAHVEVERWRGPLPPVRAFEPPATTERSRSRRT